MIMLMKVVIQKKEEPIMTPMIKMAANPWWTCHNQLPRPMEKMRSTKRITAGRNPIIFSIFHLTTPSF